ncbi:MAG: fimbrillin family protein [Muribaculaceae bacterium]|nr:fimbrillin family protein [Muribaculaceae bacterium]
MDAKYSFSPYAIAALAAAMLVMPSACNDDFGYQNTVGQQIAFHPAASAGWHEGMSVDESSPTTHCTSVRALSGGDTKLYLHTVVADNPAVERTAGSRGTTVGSTDAFKNRYATFSLSGICYTGTYPTDESQNTWTTEFAHDLPYRTANGEPAAGGRQLYWPANGKVRFFAFAPTTDDFKGEGGSLTMSAADHKGSPTITYTVPTKVTEQVDLMTACTEEKHATTPGNAITLTFGHALTAVQVKCGTGMLAGKITEVKIGGVYGTGTQVIGSGEWTIDAGSKTSYTISKEITLPSENDNNSTKPDKVHTPADTPIATDTDALTFLLLPQKLDGASMTIKFTDAATGTPRTITGPLTGNWEAGKIVTYTVSPSSIHISAKITLNKKGRTETNIVPDTIPYTGVWYDAKYKASAEITQGTDTKPLDIDESKISFWHSFDDGKTWTEGGSDTDGLLTISPQPAYTTINTNTGFVSGFKTATGTVTDDDVQTERVTPFNLGTEKGATANCYLVDQAGYYCLPLVYGNGGTPTGNANGLTKFVDYQGNEITNTTISGTGKDAVLMWQDSPDLIDPASVAVRDVNGTSMLVFRIRPQTLAQGNAVLALRDASTKDIVWSWHIWVTPHKTEFYTYFCTVTSSVSNQTYSFSQKYNLGWCDSHEDNPEREFILKAVFDMIGEEVVIPGTFVQKEYKGSDAGDNTYYQWGRKDPMLGGIYNKNTNNYTYYKKGNTGATPDVTEFTMENKQVFNQYVKVENGTTYNYSFRKNPGDMVANGDEFSTGATIPDAIKNPYMFITNSRENNTGDNFANNVNKWTGLSYRQHWHKLDGAQDYVGTTKILFNAWNYNATGVCTGYDDKQSSQSVSKTIYDPCPPGFKVPPIDAFRGITDRVNNSNTTTLGTTTFGKVSGFSDKAWSITLKETGSGTVYFPATGVRDYALRQNEWKTVKPENYSGGAYDYETFMKTTWPAFKMLTFVTSASEQKASNTNDVDKLLIFMIDNRFHNGADADYTTVTDSPKVTYYVPSSNGYGLSVRPIKE